MALINATLAELQAALLNIISRAMNDRTTTALLFQTMYNTGLRIREVLEVDRWTDIGHNELQVSLEKREGTRNINRNDIPDAITQQYINQQPFVFETYSSVNNTFKYHGIGMLFGNDTRRTTCHAFRYQYIKQLSADGLTTNEIAAILGHINPANTARYITDTIWLGS